MKANTPICPIKRPTLDAGVGIEPMELASLAAVMSSPAERPKVTAERAMALFQECQIEIWRVAAELREVRRSQAERNGKSKRDSNFIASLESCDGDQSGAVKLDSFLKACRPTAKPAWLLEKWRAFIREFENLHNEMDSWRGHPRKSDEEISSGVEKLFRTDREKGIGREEILAARVLFLDWLEIDQRQSKKTKAEKSKNARAYLPVCRKVLQKEELTDADNVILKGMNSDDLESAIETLLRKKELRENGVGLLEAAIKDANRPKSAKPRVSKKGRKRDFFSDTPRSRI